MKRKLLNKNPKEKDLSDLKLLLRDFFAVLETQETTDDGRSFYPNRITSCRVLDLEKLSEILPKIRKIAFED